MRTIGIVLAGGSGGASIDGGRPNAFLSIAGRPVVAHAVGRLSALGDFDEISVVCPKWFVPELETWIHGSRSLTKVAFVADGPTFSRSLSAGLSAAPPSGDDDLVVLHEGANPLFGPSDESIRTMLERARSTGVVVARSSIGSRGSVPSALSSVSRADFLGTLAAPWRIIRPVVERFPSENPSSLLDLALATKPEPVLFVPDSPGLVVRGPTDFYALRVAVRSGSDASGSV